MAALGQVSKVRSMNKVRVLSCAIVIGAALACALALATATGGATAPSDALASYVARPDKSLAWHEVDSGKVGNVEYVEYLLTSQTWRGIEWKHQLFVLRPANMVRDERHALLFVHGGRWKPEYESERGRTQLPSEALLFARLAESIGAPVGVLRQVPFAPMFDRTEDALIAYTFDQYLQTGEKDWPLLLPMVKSTVRAMDAMQSIVRERWGASIDSVHGVRRVEARLDRVAHCGGRQARDGRRADGDRRTEHARADGSSARDVGRSLGGDPRLRSAGPADATEDRARPGVAVDGRSVQLSPAADAAEDDPAEHERSVLAARCA